MRKKLWIKTHFIFGCLIYFPLIQFSLAQKPSYKLWVDGLVEKLKQQGITESGIKAVASQSLDHKIMALQKNQPEFKTSFKKYFNARARPLVKSGRQMIIKHKSVLDRVSQKFSIPLEMIVALWGIESNFGKYTGRFNVLRSLLTLSYKSSRAPFFESELVAFLKLVDQGKIATGHNTLGSWAGAMGHCQFMPSSVFRFATDMDLDGKIDLWRSVPDVTASIASYLKGHAWDEQQIWGYPVTLTHAFQSDDFGKAKPLSEWQKSGLILPAESHVPHSTLATAYQIDDQPYLVFQNFQILLKWNRSLKFALSVALLADQLKKG
jgi:membrane-bound lytic murein transglycosylase B